MFEGVSPSNFTNGYDTKFQEEETILIIEAIKDAYINGYKKSYIIKCLKNELGMQAYSAKFITEKSWKMLVSESSKREEGMKEKNLARLEKLYADAMDSNDPKTALAAIDQLSKLCQLYKERVEVEQINTEFVIGGEEGTN